MHEQYMGCQTLAENPFHVGAGRGGTGGGGGGYSLTNTLLPFLFAPFWLCAACRGEGAGGGCEMTWIRAAHAVSASRGHCDCAPVCLLIYLFFSLPQQRLSGVASAHIISAFPQELSLLGEKSLCLLMIMQLIKQPIIFFALPRTTSGRKL